MHAYQTLLVAVDFSEHSERALLRAIELAKGSRADIKVVHVFALATYPILEDIAVLGLPGVLDTEETQETTVLAKQNLNALLLKSGLKTEQGKLVAGIAWSEILNYATQIKADAIVLGGHGATDLSQSLGSTVENVLHHATCDVITVRLSND